MCLYVTIFLVVLCSFSIVGPSSSNQTVTDKEVNTSVEKSLRGFVHNARQVLEAQIDLNRNYSLQVKLLAKKLADIDRNLEDVQQSSTLADGSVRKVKPVSLTELDNQTRINILGERALLGYKAQQLQTELEQLTSGSGNKLEAFNRAITKAEDLFGQVMSLRFSIREGQNRSEQWHSDYVPQGKDGDDAEQLLAGQARDLVQYHSDDQARGPVFFVASATATNVKPGPEKASGAEAEAKYATSDLKKRMEEIARQAKTLQQMIFETGQKTEMVKRMEKQTFSKLADMEQLKKSWEGRKIPVNEEVVALEKKLTSDLMLYQETLKEVEGLKQQLISMFNAIFFKEAETVK